MHCDIRLQLGAPFQSDQHNKWCPVVSIGTPPHNRDKWCVVGVVFLKHQQEGQPFTTDPLVCSYVWHIKYAFMMKLGHIKWMPAIEPYKLCAAYGYLPATEHYLTDEECKPVIYRIKIRLV